MSTDTGDLTQADSSDTPRGVPVTLRPLRAFLHHYQWVHTVLGLIGNVSFFVGSVLFLWDSTKIVGVWLFIVGAAGMLIASLGRAVVNWEFGTGR